MSPTPPPQKKVPVIKAPTGAEKPGDVVLVASGATGPFDGMDGALAELTSSGWKFWATHLPYCADFAALRTALIDRGWMAPL